MLKILIIYDDIPAIGHRANNGDMYLSNRVRPVLNIFDDLSAKILIIYDGIPAIGHRANNGDMCFE